MPWIKTCWYYLLIGPPPLRCRQSQSALWSLLPGLLTVHPPWQADWNSKQKGWLLSHGWRLETLFYSFCRPAYSCRTWWPTIKNPLMKMAPWHNIDFRSIILQHCRLKLSLTLGPTMKHWCQLILQIFSKVFSLFFFFTRRVCLHVTPVLTHSHLIYTGSQFSVGEDWIKAVTHGNSHLCCPSLFHRSFVHLPLHI